ncbi:MAG: aminomethyltransferase beta-barrel domain-containing protein, partial [Planctomycetota bacterium]
WLIDEPKEPFRGLVKVRYNSKGSNAAIYPQKNYVKIEFDQQVLAVTPGQLAVVYITDDKADLVAGGGWIEAVCD